MKVGDKISVLHEPINGHIVELNGSMAIICDEDGFHRTYKLTEIVLRIEAAAYRYSLKEMDSKLAVDRNDFSASIKTSKGNLGEFWEIDLHIEELVESHSHMSNAEIVQKQISVFKSFISKVRQAKHRKCIIIHGRGQGVLKSEIHDYLHKLRSESDMKIEFLDASYKDYGQGATEIIFY